jgi:hypothetical protein
MNTTTSHPKLKLSPLTNGLKRSSLNIGAPKLTAASLSTPSVSLSKDVKEAVPVPPQKDRRFAGANTSGGSASAGGAGSSAGANGVGGAGGKGKVAPMAFGQARLKDLIKKYQGQL